MVYRDVPVEVLVEKVVEKVRRVCGKGKMCCVLKQGPVLCVIVTLTPSNGCTLQSRSNIHTSVMIYFISFQEWIKLLRPGRWFTLTCPWRWRWSRRWCDCERVFHFTLLTFSSYEVHVAKQLHSLLFIPVCFFWTCLASTGLFIVHSPHMPNLALKLGSTESSLY